MKTYFTPEILINLKKNRGQRSKLAHWASQSRARIRKLPVQDHMTHVVKIDILSGLEVIGDLHFILKIFFHCLFI